jgi:hypothetical protein
MKEDDCTSRTLLGQHRGIHQARENSYIKGREASQVLPDGNIVDPLFLPSASTCELFQEAYWEW